MTTNVRSYYVSEPFTLHCDRVLGQNLLWRHVESDGPEVHHLHLVNAGNDEEQSWSCSPSLLQSKRPELVSIRELVSDVNLPSLKRMARSYSGTMRIQKKMEMGNVRMMRMMEMIVSRTEQQSEEVSGCSSLSPIATICGANENQNKLTLAQLSPRAWNSYFSFRFSW